MSDANVNNNNPPVIRTEDVIPVRSRVSWGAIFAGAMVSLAIFLVLNMLGACVGLSVYDRVSDNSFNYGAAIWATLSTLIGLFVGGYVTSCLAVGENKTEAGIYGVILWGVMFTGLAWFMANGVKLGLTGLMSMANVGATAANNNVVSVEDQGITVRGPDGQVHTFNNVNDMRAYLNQNAPTKEQVLDRARPAAWWSLAGILLSLVASVAGSIAGSGPTLVLRRFVTNVPPRTMARV